MKYNKELAVLFKKIIHPNQEIEFIPIKVIEGYYNKEESCFIDKDGTPYYHIIENPDSYGYCYRDDIVTYKNDYKNLPPPLIKALILRTIKKYAYSYNIDKETSAPILLFSNKTNYEETNILLDDEISEFYMEKCPEFYYSYIQKENNEEEVKETKEEDKDLDIQKAYKELTSHVIDQDEVIQKLLTLIWKQKTGNKIINKNMIIDGPSGVGKSIISKKITEILNIPSVTISSNGGKFPSVDYLIIELLKKTNYNIEKAENGIIIIDKFEELIKYIAPEAEVELEKILDEGEIILTTSVGEFTFNTSNLMILGLSNLEKNNHSNKQLIGFNREGIEKERSSILDKFSLPIKMNNLNYNSFIKILESQNGLLNKNIEFLNSQGIKLKVEKSAIDKIAYKATTKNHGVKTLDEIIEKTLQVAEFEIASNPSLYSELIITAETPDNNKAYKLIRRKEM